MQHGNERSRFASPARRTRIRDDGKIRGNERRVFDKTAIGKVFVSVEVNDFQAARLERRDVLLVLRESKRKVWRTQIRSRDPPLMSVPVCV